MFLEKLKVFHFKNLKEKNFLFSSKINAFVGQNGIGKTNLLDAIYYLSFTRSYLNLNDRENISFGEDFFFLEGTFKKANQIDLISCLVKKKERKIVKKNQKSYQKIMDHIGHYPVVIVSPYDHDLIKEGSESRRRFIDSMIAQVDKAFLQELLSYQRALYQRNALLKNFSTSKQMDYKNLEIYNDQLHLHGEEIFRKRELFLEEFTKEFIYNYNLLAKKQEKVALVYKSTLKNIPLKESLITSQHRDLLLGYTSFGIHKDEIDFIFNETLIKKIGSQGEQKSFLIALKLAQFDFLKKKMGFSPILLLDDIFDKLDQDRLEYLINRVDQSYFKQVFISDTHPIRTKNLFMEMKIEHEIFHLK